jgi:hypothetical protein
MTPLGDHDALVAPRDIVDETTKSCLRFGQRNGLHDLTSLLTNWQDVQVGTPIGRASGA